MTADIAINHSTTVNQLTTPTCGSSSPSSSMVSPPCSCLRDSIWVHLCPGPQGLLIGLCGMPLSASGTNSSRCARHFYHWEEVVADMWGSERVSDPGVSGADLMCVQTLPLLTARWDNVQGWSNDRSSLREKTSPPARVPCATRTHTHTYKWQQLQFNRRMVRLLKTITLRKR